MRLPDLVAYQAAVQHPSTAFADPHLRTATVTTGQLGLPRAVAGNFAVTYQLRAGSRQWAVRCFHREAADRGARYAAISQTLGQLRDGPLVPIEYLEPGVRVGQSWFPITKMPWIEGFPLNRAVEASLSRPKVLREYERAFVDIVHALRREGIAHGDLQHGNILVEPSGSLRLVDYDGMFVPALRGRPPSETGDPNYQHPRRAAQFDADLDRFAALVIVVALRALAAAPRLWHTYNTGDNLLFRRADFAEPTHSALFDELRALPEIKDLTDTLVRAATGDYARVPLLDDVLPKARPTAQLAPKSLNEAGHGAAAPHTPVPHTLKAAQVAVLNTLYGPQRRPKSRSWKLRRATVVEALAFSPDGLQLACGEARGRITLRDASTGRTLRTLRLPAANTRLRALLFSPRSRLLAVTSDGTRLCVWDVLERQVLRQLELRAPGETTAFAFSRDERSIAIAGPRGSVQISIGRETRSMPIGRRASCLAFSHDGSELLMATADGCVRAFHSRSGTLVAELARFAAPLTGIALGPDGCSLASAGRDGSLWLRRVPAHMRPEAETPRAWRVFDWLRRAAALTI